VIAYKFLATGGIGAISGAVWPRPSPGQPAAWLEAPVQVCRSGIHACLPGQLAYWLHEELWRVELDGDSIPGLDCLIVPRARLLEKVSAWSDGGGAARFATAVRDHAAHTLAGLPAEQRDRLAGYVADSSWHVQHGALESPALAALCAAMAVAKIAPAHLLEEAYRRERAWQSAWIVQEMGLA
jgi:hypothetical protein